MLKQKMVLKKEARKRIRKRIRKKIKGTAERPRVFVSKSNRYIYSLAIDDETGRILAAASSLEKEYRDKNQKTKNIKTSKAVGEMMAKRLKEKKVKKVVFDRGGNLYHGRVAALASSAKEKGLEF